MRIPEVRVVETQKIDLREPLAIMGFTGAGLVGVIAVSQVIEQMKMREIAHVQSRYLPPAAVFIGGKLRHPFRIYSDPDGAICATICEIPIPFEGFYPIALGLLEWLEKKGAREAVVLEGIPVDEIPKERAPFCVAEEGKCREFDGKGIKTPSQGIITGIAGSILNECLTRKIVGISLLTPAITFMPDPEGATKLIDALNSAYGLGINTTELVEKGKEIENKLREIADRYKRMRTIEEKGGVEKMYA